jgi:hypothetical protein
MIGSKRVQYVSGLCGVGLQHVQHAQYVCTCCEWMYLCATSSCLLLLAEYAAGLCVRRRCVFQAAMEAVEPGLQLLPCRCVFLQQGGLNLCLLRLDGVGALKKWDLRGQLVVEGTCRWLVSAECVQLLLQ